MSDNYIRVKGSDIGILVGNSPTLMPDGALVFKPTTELVPNAKMDHNELKAAMQMEGEDVIFPYQAVRQVFVNDKSVWKNPACFDNKKHGFDLYFQQYVGRGDVQIELRNDLEIEKNELEKEIEKFPWLSVIN